MNQSPWILTVAGREHYIAGAQAMFCNNAPDIGEIAHALAQINRYTGHACRPYSVAEHSLLVCGLVAAAGLNAHAQRAALMHDAHEAFVGDVSSPMKEALGTAWLGVESTQAALVRSTYGLRTAHTAYQLHIKRADLIALATERRDLMRFDTGRHQPWPLIDGTDIEPADAIDLNSPARAAMSWRHHRDAFLQRFHELDALCYAMKGATE